MSHILPNIIFITLHDLGINLPAYKAMIPDIPNLQRLCRESVVFENHFSTCPLCSPAKASIQTGRYPHVNGMNGLVHHGFGMALKEKCIPHYLESLGYHTALYGTQHEASDIRRLGFSELGRDNGCPGRIFNPTTPVGSVKSATTGSISRQGRNRSREDQAGNRRTKLHELQSSRTQTCLS